MTGIKKPKVTTEDHIWRSQLARMRKRASNAAERHGLAEGYRSGLELKMGLLLTEKKIPFEFEADACIVEWMPLPVKHKYHPDFVVLKHPKTGKKIHLIIETKGRFMPEDMHKHQAIRIQNPHLDIRFVFSGNPEKDWYRKAVRKTYADFCKKLGAPYCSMRQAPEVLDKWMEELA